MTINNRTDRLYYIDWLRVIGVLIVFCFHTSMLFVSWKWHINNSESSFIMDTFVRFVHLWIMPLFFLLSGASAHCSLRTRKDKDYIAERFKRLIVPLCFGVLFIVPLQVYLERFNTGDFNGSFLYFYFYFFDGFYPKGNFTLNHLWFLLYLFVISIITLPVLRAMKNRIKKSAVMELLSGRNTWMLFLLALLFIFIEGALRYVWPAYLYPADIILFITYFIFGHLLASESSLRDAVKKYSTSAFLTGSISFSVITTLYYLNKIPAPGSSLSYVVFQSCWSITGWFWIVSILGFGVKHLNSGHRLLSYANEAVLPFYILHQTVILIIGYYVVLWEISLLTKYLFIISTAFFITSSLCFVVRQSNLARIIFGLKIKSKVNKLMVMNAQPHDPF